MQERRESRNRVLKGGAVIQGAGRSEISCVLRNQSPGGAELKVPPEAHLPANFQLYVPVDGIAYDCRLRWRRNDKVGVEFLGRGPKPKLHYG
jgi:hypothetical protein